jgi:replication fork clamp-binding protein CrfC
MYYKYRVKGKWIPLYDQAVRTLLSDLFFYKNINLKKLLKIGKVNLRLKKFEKKILKTCKRIKSYQSNL